MELHEQILVIGTKVLFIREGTLWDFWLGIRKPLRHAYSARFISESTLVTCQTYLRGT